MQMPQISEAILRCIFFFSRQKENKEKEGKTRVATT